MAFTIGTVRLSSNTQPKQAKNRWVRRGILYMYGGRIKDIVESDGGQPQQSGKVGEQYENEVENGGEGQDLRQGAQEAFLSLNQRRKGKTALKMSEQERKRVELTSLANEEKEPDAAGEVEQERDGVARVAQQVEGGEEGGEEAGPEPASRDRGVVEEWVRARLVGAGGAADEGGREAPGEADENEGEDVVDCWGGWCCRWGVCW